jgi:hypothetical protein
MTGVRNPLAQWHSGIAGLKTSRDAACINARLQKSNPCALQPPLLRNSKDRATLASQPQPRHDSTVESQEADSGAVSANAVLATQVYFRERIEE